MFSVIIPTRNRPAQLARAVASVRAQRDAQFELIVVNDGSAPEHAAALGAVEATLSGIGRMVHLPARTAGHGPSFAVNEGAAASSGRYLCFLDDDDHWTDPTYLAQAAAMIAAAPVVPDVLFFQQRAVTAAGVTLPGPIWLEHLAPGPASLPFGARPVRLETVLATGNFCHLNTLVIRREFLHQINGLTESLRYENDRDLFLRAIDAAGMMLYAPAIVATHAVPDPALQANASTALSQLEKWQAQCVVFQRAALAARNAALRRFARRQAGYTLKKMALALARAGQHPQALACAVDALAAGPTLRWLGMTVLIAARWVR